MKEFPSVVFFNSPYFPTTLSLSPAQIRNQWERSLSLVPTSTSPTLKGEVLFSNLLPKLTSQPCSFTFFSSFDYQMEAAAAGAAQAAIFHACGVQQQHAQPCGPHHTGHEHRPAIHESARQPHARSVGLRREAWALLWFQTCGNHVVKWLNWAFASISRTSGEQQLLLSQHQHRSRWLRVVCCARALLAGYQQILWEVSKEAGKRQMC